MKSFAIKSKLNWGFTYVIEYLDYNAPIGRNWVIVETGTNRRKMLKRLNELKKTPPTPVPAGRHPGSCYYLHARLTLGTAEQFVYENS